MLQAKSGDTVKVHYTGSYPSGEIFDSSINREPLEFSLGQGQMIPGFENAVTGMQVGEEKTINLAPEEGYGQPREEMIFPIERDQIPDHIELKPGLQLNAQTNQGQTIQVVVKDINEKQITVDANHPLAGKELVFDIKLLEITPADQAGKKPLLFD